MGNIHANQREKDYQLSHKKPKRTHDEVYKESSDCIYSVLYLDLWKIVLDQLDLKSKLALRLACKDFKVLLDTMYLKMLVVVDEGYYPSVVTKNMYGLDFSRCGHKTVKIKKTLKTLSPGLEKLNLQKCQITDRTLKNLSTTITWLDLSENTKITDAGLKCLRDFQLKYLDLSYCTQLTDKGLQYLPTTLEVLKLSGLDITNRGLACLRAHPLTEITLSDCKRITNAGLAFLPTTVKYVDLRNTPNVAKENDKVQNNNYQNLIRYTYYTPPRVSMTS